LSYALKEIQNPRLWLGLSELFLSQIEGDFCRKTMVLVPAPPGNSVQVDHAGRYANALSLLTGMKVVSCLERVAGSGSQKLQGRQMRLKRRLGINKNISHISGLTPILVDDIVTTGGTAKAAKLALKIKEPLQVWTLYCRPQHTLV
jgi:predicted amidophosphoribosyltransferase